MMSRWIPLFVGALAACGKPDAVALPPLSGPHSVGVTTLGAFYLTAWYPAAPGTGFGAPTYASDAMLAFYGMVPGDMAPVAVAAEINAAPELGADPAPLVVLAPGGSSWVELSTHLATELASHGNVVFTVQPDAAREGGFNAGAGVPSDDLLEVLERAAFDARAAQIREAIDLASAPDTVAAVGPIDLGRIAVGGHSIGGDVAFRLAGVEPRIDAVFDLDGALHPETLAAPPPVPGLAVLANLFDIALHPEDCGTTPDVQAGLDTLAWLPTSDVVVTVGLTEAGHYAVTDLPALLDALPKALAEESAIDVGAIGVDGPTNTAALVRRFLDAVLREGVPPEAVDLAAGLPFTEPDPLE